MVTGQLIPGQIPPGPIPPRQIPLDKYPPGQIPYGLLPPSEITVTLGAVIQGDVCPWLYVWLHCIFCVNVHQTVHQMVYTNKCSQATMNIYVQ